MTAREATRLLRAHGFDCQERTRRSLIYRRGAEAIALPITPQQKPDLATLRRIKMITRERGVSPR